MPFLSLPRQAGAGLQLWGRNPSLSHWVGCGVSASCLSGRAGNTAGWISQLVNRQGLLDDPFPGTFFEVVFLNFLMKGPCMDLKFLLNIGIFESEVQFLDHASSWTLNSLNVLFNLKKQSYKIVGLVNYDVFVFTVNVTATSKCQCEEMANL